MPKKVDIELLAVVDAEGNYHVSDSEIDDVSTAIKNFEESVDPLHESTGFRIYRLKTTVEAAEGIVDLVLVAEEITPAD
jgi:hypothetical protein